MRRTLAAALVFLALLALIFGGGRLLAPVIVAPVRELQRPLPSLLANAQSTLAETADQVGLADLDELLLNNVSGGGDVGQAIARTAVPFVVGLGRFLLEFLVFLIATFFFLRDAPRLFDWVRRLLPPSLPAVVIFSLLSGGALFGLLGVFVAVPFAATLRLVLIYVSAKLRDQDPFPKLEEELASVHEPVSEHPAARPVGRRAHS